MDILYGFLHLEDHYLGFKRHSISEEVKGLMDIVEESF